MTPLLTWLIVCPLLGLALLSLLPQRWASVGSLLTALLTAALSGMVALQVDASQTGFQLVERHAWMPMLGAEYSLGVDGLSALLLALSSVVSVTAILFSWNTERYGKAYYALLLLQLSATLLTFCARDFLLFFIGFEFTLVPLYFLIGIWGGERRRHAALKFFLYTLAGSLLLLVGGIGLYLTQGAQTGRYSMALDALTALSAPPFWMVLSMALGFAVKTPMLPFHTWLPDAHVEAPTAGSVLLAGVLLKLGTYGLCRLVLPFLSRSPELGAIATGGAWLSLAAIVYGGLVCLAQRDWKRLIAYSSVSHMGFCTLGLFTGNTAGLTGGMLQQVNHGLSAAMLFLIVGFAYERTHTRAIAEYGGLSQPMPGLNTVFLFAILSSAGLPLLNGFVGEFAVLQGAFARQAWWAGVAVLGVVLSAAYLLWLHQRVMLGMPAGVVTHQLPDLKVREWLTLLPLAAWCLWIGLSPAAHIRLLEQPAQALVTTRPGVAWTR